MVPKWITATLCGTYGIDLTPFVKKETKILPFPLDLLDGIAIAHLFEIVLDEVLGCDPQKACDLLDLTFRYPYIATFPSTAVPLTASAHPRIEGEIESLFCD